MSKNRLIAMMILVFGVSNWLPANGKTESVPDDPALKTEIREASETTKAENKKVRETLRFSDTRDFDRADRGFIATLETTLIETEDGSFVYDAELYDFPDSEAPETVNPSFWRQSTLNGRHGLYRVTEGIYQIRGFDLANMSFIRVRQVGLS